MTNDLDNPTDDSLPDRPDRLNIIGKGIPLEAQQAYLAYAASIDEDEHINRTTAFNEQKLLNPETSLEEKKLCLVLLANQGTVEACLAINTFVKTASEALENWGIIALETGWLLAESELLDQDGGMILTGLGGEAHRLRFFCAIPAKDTNLRLPEIKQAFILACNHSDSVMETCQVHPEYIALQILISQDVAVATVIEAGITKCNKRVQLVYPDYFVTNTSIPTNTEILGYMKQLKEG